MEFCPCVIERGDLGQMYDRKCGRRYDSYRTPISVTKRFPLGFGLMMMMHTLYWVICKDYLRLVDPANSAASLLLLSRLEGNSDIRNESWRLKGDVRDCKRLNSRKEVCLCNMRSVA